MDNRSESELREKILFTNGKLLSGFSHELKNQMAVINESVGLLQDYVEMGRIKDDKLIENIMRITTRLEQRTESVAEMASRLNSFSHRFDSPTSSFDLNQLVIEQLFFFKRFARLKKISLTVKGTDTPLYLFNSPSLLQHLLQNLLELALNVLSEGDTIDVFTAQLSSNPVLGLLLQSQTALEAPSSYNSMLSPELHLCLEKTGAEIQFSSENIGELVIEIQLQNSGEESL